jgi:acetyltransferase-like isoleucine patch superfamily enzyme
VVIGSFTYIGSGAIILPGSKIGDHCVIGAGAVVTSDVPPYSAAFGVPARIVGRVVTKDGAANIEYFRGKLP